MLFFTFVVLVLFDVGRGSNMSSTEMGEGIAWM